MRAALLKALKQIAQVDAKAVVITADLGYGLLDEFAKEYPSQFLNVGIAEQNMMGIATGLALEGYTVYAYSIANFATMRCLEQIRNGPVYHCLNVNVIAAGGGFSYGSAGMSHHATEDLAVMRSFPNVTVVAPCDDLECYGAMIAFSKKRGVGYIRIEKQSLSPSPTQPEFFLGKARRLCEGSDLAIFACGTIVGEALKVVDRCRQHGIGVRVVSMHTISPIDREEVCDAASKIGRIICLEEHSQNGGLGSAIAEVCFEEQILLKSFHRFGIKGFAPFVGDQAFLRNYHGVDVDGICRSLGV